MLESTSDFLTWESGDTLTTDDAGTAVHSISVEADRAKFFRIHQ
jgi:hypothetical protein